MCDILYKWLCYHLFLVIPKYTCMLCYGLRFLTLTIFYFCVTHINSHLTSHFISFPHNFMFQERQSSLPCSLHGRRPCLANSPCSWLVLGSFLHPLWFMSGELFIYHVFTCFDLVSMLADFSRVWWLMLIWFLVD